MKDPVDIERTIRWIHSKDRSGEFIPYRWPKVRSRTHRGFLMRRVTRRRIPDGPVRSCRDCGYDLRGNPGAVRCPECGADLGSARASRPLDATDIASASGLDLTAVSLFASLPAITGIVLLGLAGRMAAILAAGCIGFRVAGVRRFQGGPLASVLPPWFRRTLLIATALETVAALTTLTFLVVTPSPGSAGVWRVSAMACWAVTAAGSVAGIGIACGRLGRARGSSWAPITGTTTAILGAAAGLSVAGLAGVLIWNALGTVRIAGVGTVLIVLAILLALGGGLVSILLARILLLSVESMAISTAIDDLHPRRDPLRDIGIPMHRPEPSVVDDPLPLEPAKPPIRTDLR